MPTDDLDLAEIADALRVPLYKAVLAPSSGVIHLRRVVGQAAAQRTVCDKPVARGHPPRLFQADGCRHCAERALQLGVTFASDGGALVNLQRFRRRLIPHQMT